MDSEKLGAVMEDKCIVGGGVQDAYGEDSATEDQPVTPCTVSVASSAGPANIEAFAR
ncbi:NADP-malic enzyme 4 [Actinidia rufa]|uniref:NADP-malic enzyme 4 n=1 Tax=Actinidia rufa TaxID=165716 RepID=A0A7J0GCT3_9ERIC|nr:NADP-malic enzyme 4 [Actinidia rufa]